VRVTLSVAKLDPHATFREQLDNGYFTYTFDYLAAELYHHGLRRN
jgi:hypothetical protein